MAGGPPPAIAFFQLEKLKTVLFLEEKNQKKFKFIQSYRAATTRLPTFLDYLSN